MNPSLYPWKRYFGFVAMAMVMLSSCFSPFPPLAEELNNPMALPDWAYGQRQRLSPILIKGEVMAVSCEAPQCTLTLKILEVLRNQSPKTLSPGDLVVITFVGNLPSKNDPSNPVPPVIGLPTMAVTVPTRGEQKYAWLRPMDGEENTYELMAGEYGFGPNLEDVHR